MQARSGHSRSITRGAAGSTATIAQGPLPLLLLLEEEEEGCRGGSSEDAPPPRDIPKGVEGEGEQAGDTESEEEGPAAYAEEEEEEEEAEDAAAGRGGSRGDSEPHPTAGALRTSYIETVTSVSAAVAVAKISSSAYSTE